MTWNYAYTPQIWPLLLTVLFLLFLAIYSWRRRSVPGALPFMIGCLFVILGITGLLMTYLAVDPETKIFWFKFQSAWMLLGATAVTCFILDYAWPGHWLTRRNLILLSILPLFGMLYFFLFASLPFPLEPVKFIVTESVTVSYNLFGWVIIVYSLVLFLINLIVFTWLFIRSPQHRWPVVLMAASQIATRVAVMGNPPALDAQVFNIPLIALPYIPYAIALFGFRIFDPIPMARQMAIELQAGMVVLDNQERVVSLNPAAEKILGTTTNNARGRPVREWLPAYPERHLADSLGTEIEFSLGSGPELRDYSLAISQLKDFRGLDVGRLLLLRDVTGQKLAQAQILEQQKVLATQGERERMARELHDSLGQVLSYTTFQVESAAKLSRGGQGDAAVEQLDRLGSVVREAHADLREVILNLHSTASLQQPFFIVVKQYLDAFTSSYDIQTILNARPGPDEVSLSPEIQMQVFRILQEALSNARKHGQAHQVQVTFAEKDGILWMTIQDDGCGFNPDQVANSGGSHYGLQFMRERATELAGSLQVQSTPGAGTRVELEVPLNGRS